MILSDRYDVIMDYKKSKTLDINQIENFFENLIKNNQKIYIPKHVLNNITAHESININNLIFYHLGDYLKSIRKNIRSNIKRNREINLVDTYVTLINSLNQRIYDLEYFTYYPTDLSIFRKKCYNSIFETLLSDPVTKIPFTNDIMNIKLKNKIKFLFDKIKKHEPDFFSDWCIPFIKNSVYNYNTENIDEKPIPPHVTEYINFGKWANIMFTYLKHFNFLNESQLDNIFLDLHTRQFNCLFKIIEEDKMSNIISFLNNEKNKKALNYIMEHSEDGNQNFLNMKILNLFLERYDKDKSLEDICNIFLVISTNYPKTFSSFLMIFSKEIAKIISKNELYDDINNIIIDSIINESGCYNVEFDSQLFQILSHIDDKNIIFKKYHQELMLRLLQDDVEMSNINLETYLVTQLSRCFNSAQRYKLKRTIEDVHSSIEMRDLVEKGTKKIIDKAQKQFNSNLNVNIITTSYNIWDSQVLDIATRFDDSNVRSDLAKFFIFYSRCYSESYDKKRYLNWYLHTGSVNVSYTLNNNKEVNLKLLPLQSLCLEEFDYENESILIEDFLNFEFLKSYDIKERQKVLDIFLTNRILIIEDNCVILNLEEDISGTISLIDQFFEISSMPDTWKEKADLEIANNKVDVVKTNINHHLKTKVLNYYQLYQFCQEINTFKVNHDIMKSALDYMIKHDFIKVNDNNEFEKLFY